MDTLKFPKPVKGAHRKAQKIEHDSKMETFRIEVMALDRKFECCGYRTAFMSSPECPPPDGRSQFEVAHLVGKGRKPEWKYETFNGIRVSWWFHDWMDKRHDVYEMSSDERKVILLKWHKFHNPEHFESRGWALPLKALKASVARKKVGT